MSRRLRRRHTVGDMPWTRGARRELWRAGRVKMTIPMKEPDSTSLSRHSGHGVRASRSARYSRTSPERPKSERVPCPQCATGVGRSRGDAAHHTAGCLRPDRGYRRNRGIDLRHSIDCRVAKVKPNQRLHSREAEPRGAGESDTAFQEGVMRSSGGSDWTSPKGPVRVTRSIPASWSRRSPPAWRC